MLQHLQDNWRRLQTVLKQERNEKKPHEIDPYPHLPWFTPQETSKSQMIWKDTFYTIFVAKILVRPAFGSRLQLLVSSCLDVMLCCNTVLLWSSRNALWMKKLKAGNYISMNVGLNRLFLISWIVPLNSLDIQHIIVDSIITNKASPTLLHLCVISMWTVLSMLYSDTTLGVKMWSEF